MISVKNACFSDGAKIYCFGEVVATVEEVFKMGLLISIWAEVNTEIFVGLGCVVEGNGNPRIVVSITVANSDFDR